MLIALARLMAGPLSCPAEPDATNSPVRPLGNGLYEIGLVRLHSRDRTVTFPATVNLREETVEYAVVHKTGKTHESLFRTDARPLDLQVSLLLLGLKPTMTNAFGVDGKGTLLHKHLVAPSVRTVHAKCSGWDENLSESPPPNWSP